MVPYYYGQSTRTGQLLRPIIELPEDTVLDTGSPLSYMRWISSLYSINDLSGIAGVNSTTSPIFSLHMGSLIVAWFNRGLSSSFRGNPQCVHLELPQPVLSSMSLMVEFAENSCTDICNTQNQISHDICTITGVGLKFQNQSFLSETPKQQPKRGPKDERYEQILGKAKSPKNATKTPEISHLNPLLLN